MNWVREGCKDFTEVTGGAVIAFGRLGKALKPLVELHSWYVVRPAWRHFVKVTELRFATPEHFARTYPNWVVKPKAPPDLRQFREVLEGNRLRLVPDDAA